jgi:hypothetical protein
VKSRVQSFDANVTAIDALDGGAVVMTVENDASGAASPVERVSRRQMSVELGGTRHNCALRAVYVSGRRLRLRTGDPVWQPALPQRVEPYRRGCHRRASSRESSSIACRSLLLSLVLICARLNKCT